MNRQEILDRIRKGRAEVQALVERKSAERLDHVPGPKPDWSAKDMLAHLSFWECLTLDKLSGRSTASSWGDVNVRNAVLLQQSRVRPVTDVLLEFFESGKRVIDEIERLSDEDLMRESPWGDGKQLWEHLADDTCIHYEQHLPALRAWAKSL